MKGIRAVLFDAGGTLIHVDGIRVCRAADVSYDPVRFRGAEVGAVSTVRAHVLARPDSRDRERLTLYLDALLRGLGLESEGDRRAAAAGVAAEHRRANLWSQPADGAARTLETLRARGYRVGVISNADGRVRGLLEDAGLISHLELVVDSEEVGVEKPDPRIFREATERLGLAPGECAYVGDIYEIDVVGASGAGLVPILIGDGAAPDGTLRVPDLEALGTLFTGIA